MIDVTYVLLCVIAVQLIVIAYMAKIHAKERKDLYDRIMCRDVKEYNKIHGNNAPKPPSGHRRVMDNWRRKGVRSDERDKYAE